MSRPNDSNARRVISNAREVVHNALDLARRTDERRIMPSVSGDGSMRRWHVVRVAAKFERQAADETSFVAKQIAQAGFEVYSVKLRRMILPPSNQLSHEQRKIRHRFAREKLEAMFPGYEFVRFDTAADPWHDIFKIVGIYGMLCENNLPVPVPDAWIAKLKGSEVNGAIPAALPAAEVFAIGETVRINNLGPLAGLTGTIDRMDSAGRIRLLVDLLGGHVPVNLSYAEIEKP